MFLFIKMLSKSETLCNNISGHRDTGVHRDVGGCSHFYFIYKILITYHLIDRIISTEGFEMIILPSTSLRNQYNEISEKCKQSGEPIYLTKNGEGDLVVMSVDAYEKQAALLKLKEQLLDIELEQKNGAKYYSLDELKSALKKIVENE